MAEQLTFNLPVLTALGREDFFVSDANALAAERLEHPETWPNGKLVLTGPTGAGKTHLAQIWATTHGSEVIGATSLATRDIPAQASSLAIEVPENMDATTEEALFHLHNHMLAQRLPLLLVAREAPARWRLKLPDLKSRMEATDVVQIAAPDDALLSAVLVKLFTDRQIQIAPNLIPWIIARTERSFAAIQATVAALDAAALAEKRAITRPFARRVLDNMTKDAR